MAHLAGVEHLSAFAEWDGVGAHALMTMRDVPNHSGFSRCVKQVGGTARFPSNTPPILTSLGWVVLWLFQAVPWRRRSLTLEQTSHQVKIPHCQAQCRRLVEQGHPPDLRLGMPQVSPLA